MTATYLEKLNTEEICAYIKCCGGGGEEGVLNMWLQNYT